LEVDPVKPKLVIKTTKGRRYLQLLDLHGNLIHVGSAEKPENWAAGIHALKDNYEGLAIQEAVELDAGMFSEYVNHFRMHPPAAGYKAIHEKQVAARVQSLGIAKIVEELPNEQIARELVEYHTTLTIKYECGVSVGLSPELYELLSPFIKSGGG
jgi:hypothetical protein